MASGTSIDVDSDPFASHFSDWDPTAPQKVLIKTSPKATQVEYGFYKELVDIFLGAGFVRRKKWRGFGMGRIGGWAADRGYQKMSVANEDAKKPSKLSVLCGVSNVVRDRASLHSETQVAENGMTHREGIRGTLDAAGIRRIRRHGSSRGG